MVRLADSDEQQEVMAVTLRTARVVYLLAMGRRLTTAEVARLTHMTWRGALDLMRRLETSRHVPIYYDDDDKRWSCLTDLDK